MIISFLQKKYIIKNFSLAILKRRQFWTECFRNTPGFHYSNIPKKEVRPIRYALGALRLALREGGFQNG
jgi:hypothetical protein